jgi:peptide/nickel transport system substrate-binding protein
MCPMPNSKYFKEKYATAWAQYDPDLANQMLDEMGLDERDGDGFRLRPDGERLKYNIEHPGERAGASVPEFTEMVVTFWREVGIDATTKELDSSLWGERMDASLIHCGIWHNDEVTDMLFPFEMYWYLPLDDGGRSGDMEWGRWVVSEGAEGEEPPAEILKLVENFNKMQVTNDEAERLALGQEILDYLAEYPRKIGAVVESPAPLIFNKNMRNLPRPKVPMGWDTYGISAYHPEAFFYEGGKRA